MSVEVKVQRDTKVFLSFNNEQEAGELKQLLYAVDWNRCPWARELVEALDEAEVNTPSDLALEHILDLGFVRLV
jgi:hypothetical protein